MHGWGEVPSHIEVGRDARRGGRRGGPDLRQAPLPTPRSRWTPSWCSIRQGKFVRSFGKEYHGGGHGIDIRKEGGEEFLYLCDVKNRLVAKTTLKGEQLWKMSYPEQPGVYQKRRSSSIPRTSPSAPTAVFTSPTATARTTSTSTTRTPSGFAPGAATAPRKARCRRRTASGSTTGPGREPSLVVADRANARLQYFTLDGQVHEHRRAA